MQVNTESRRSQNRVSLSHRVGVQEVDFIQLLKIRERQALSRSLRKGDPSNCRTLMELNTREEGGAKDPPDGHVPSHGGTGLGHGVR